MYQSLDESGSAEPLYSKTQTVFVKKVSTEEKPRELNVYVTSSLSKVSKQSLFVQITDEEDPYLLYSILLTEEEYACLKSSQGLLVDFYNFPHELVRLFEECRKDGKESKFLLMLEEEAKNDSLDAKKTYLRVVEANNFKHLCHLQLQVSSGTDSDIKKLMLNKIKILKDINSRKEGSITQLNAQVLHLTGEISKKNEELVRVQQKWNDEKLAFTIESTKEINDETEKLRKTQAEWQLKMQRERKDMEEKFLATIKDKESEISRLRLENQILIDKRSDSESVVKDQQKQIEILEKELSIVKWDLSSMRKQSSKLDSDYHEKEKSVYALKTRIAVLEQELKDKVTMLNSCNERKTRLEDILNDKEKVLTKKRISLQNISDELMKANEIIAKFQKELAVANSKMKVRTCVALEQDKVVESCKLKINELDAKVRENEKLIKLLTDSESELKKKVSELEDQIDLKDKTLKDNERMIEWLNRRHDLARENITDWSPPSTTVPLSSTPYSLVNSCKEHIDENINKGHKDSPKSPNVVNETPLSTASGENKKKAGINAEKPSKPVGFKRVSFPHQVSTIPSSYFSK